MADGIFQPTEVSADLERLEKAMRRLRIEYEMFLSQAVKWPPHQRLAEIGAILRHYLKNPPRRTVDRFKFNTLSHRHTTAMERWSRRLRKLEEQGAASRFAKKDQARTALTDVNKPYTLAATKLAEGQAVGDQLRDFYLSYKQARKARGLPVSNLNYAAFADTMKETLQQARNKNTGRDLELRVDEVGGKVRISVRAVKDADDDKGVRA
ncbi:MAG: hypothetical protein U0V87_16325 [Acidobacteriota bacterium]